MQRYGQQCRHRGFLFIQCVALLSLTHPVAFATARSFLDLNIKSRAASNWLAKNGIHNQTIDSLDSQQQELSQMINLDFSGHIQSWLVGTSGVDSDEGVEVTVEDPTRQIKPLFGINGKACASFLPNIFIGCRYDFERTKYGFTSFDAIFRWNAARNEGSISPSMMELRTTTGLVDDNQRSHELHVQWDRLGRLPLLIKAKQSPIMKQISCKMPLHRRMDYELQIRSILGELQHATNVNVNRESDREWWLPKIALGSSGVLESLNTAVVPHPLARSTGIHKDRGLGIRFRVRHRLQWSPFCIGSTSGDEDEGTALTLELEDLGAHEASALHVQLRSFLERPLDKIHLSIVHQITPRYLIR